MDLEKGRAGKETLQAVSLLGAVYNLSFSLHRMAGKDAGPS